MQTLCFLVQLLCLLRKIQQFFLSCHPFSGLSTNFQEPLWCSNLEKNFPAYIVKSCTMLPTPYPVVYILFSCFLYLSSSFLVWCFISLISIIDVVRPAGDSYIASYDSKELCSHCTYDNRMVLKIISPHVFKIVKIFNLFQLTCIPPPISHIRLASYT